MTQDVSKGEYAHFMLKEIFEQSQASQNALSGLQSIDQLDADFFGQKGNDILPKTEGILILACGTSYHAGELARYWLEAMAEIPVTVELANEFRFRKSAFRKNHLVVAISQSGNTSDTVAAVEEAKKQGYENLLAICNVEDSTLMKMADLKFFTNSGPEIGIASTKALIGQMVGLFLLTLCFAKIRQTKPPEKLAKAFGKLSQLPQTIAKVLELADQIKPWAEYFKHKTNALFIGRKFDYPMAMEGALKLKETSYIHSEAFAAGEFRHGPMALIDENMPTIALVSTGDLLDSMKTIIGEIVDKKGRVFVVADENSGIQNTDQISVIEVPELCCVFVPFLHVIPLQLLAYYTTLAKGLDVDQPRNLVKEVMAE
jgi:glucosamine--fructose-6-phosphate aminotransferase (isomerizing)